VPKKAKKAPYRITLDLSPEAERYLIDLQERTHLGTKVAVFKAALNIMDFISHELSGGNKFIIVGPKGEKKQVVWPLSILRGPRGEEKF
jgi:hypothetical protein